MDGGDPPCPHGPPQTVNPAFGIEGDAAGATGDLRINGERVDPRRQYVLRRGKNILLATPGGGGHGVPG